MIPHQVTIGLAQYPITFHQSPEAWAMHTEQWVSDGVRQGAQLLLFPEYASMELVSLMSVADQADLQVQVRRMDALKTFFMEVFGDLARKYKVVVVAPGFPAMDSDKTYNRTWVFSPSGVAGYQDKWMMTRFENEDWMIDAGAPELTVFEADWGNFGIQTCYDIEFPIGSALLCRHGAQLILAPSCTETIRGATRVHVGARARALENQCYVGVSQVVGDAPWSLAVDINYGYCAAYSTPDTGLPEEGIVASYKPDDRGWLIQSLDLHALDHVRKAGAVLNYQDHATLHYQFRNAPANIRRVAV